MVVTIDPPVSGMHLNAKLLSTLFWPARIVIDALLASFAATVVSFIGILALYPNQVSDETAKGVIEVESTYGEFVPT